MEIYNYDKSWVDYREQKMLTKSQVGKRVKIFYNHRGREKNFYGVLKSVHGDEIELEQKRQSVYLRLPEVIALEVIED
ncbi:MAG TPA: hypothetical protein ENI49_01300 [Thermoplasmatales archaeon]|nr:hypothetical protein [Thermoplasmatales archaeon]